MGIGPADTIGLAKAREMAAAVRREILAGIDPIDAKREARDQAKVATAKAMTFRECGEAYIAAHEAGWRNPKHRYQWRQTLDSYAYPVIGNLPVQAVDTGLVAKALEAIWTAKPETATRLRGRIEAVLDWATVRGFRTGDNPARWRGHLDHLLPARSKVAKVEHHAALDYRDVPSFMADLRQREGTSPRALEFAILTAARTGEVINATWAEIDLAERVWTIPGERMKAGREHRIPLSDPAMAVLGDTAGQGGAFLFPGATGAGLSNMAMLKLLRRMGRGGDLTTHGFRSTFSDWCAERTAFPAEVREMALAHAVGDKVEAAYRRGDLFEKRRKLADAWAKFCAEPATVTGGEVVALRR
jgi:integrase